MTAPDPDTTNLDAALAYAARGWRVVPIPPGQKHPGIAAWQTAGTTDAERIRHWWTAAPDHGIGIVTGATSGLWVLDVDVADGKTGDETLAELEAAYEPLPATHEVLTGSGGRHLYFAWPDGHEVRNSAGNRLGPGLDVRGEGGQVLAPPTIHPNGRPYVVEASAPDTIAEAPGWLLALLDAGDDHHEHAQRTTALTPAGDRPGDLWAAQTTWDDLLAADGWTCDGPSGDGGTGWTRPGKDRRQGISATVGYKGSDVLKVFTSSHPHLRAEGTYTKLGYLASTRHGGDHAAAARALAAEGFRAERPWVDPVIALAGAAQPVEGEPWPEPQPIAGPEPLPPFPVDTLPDWARDHVEGIADNLQVPVDLTAMLTIGALAAAATGRAQVRLGHGWLEPLNLYLVVAMRSGAGKSPAEKACTGWLRRWERQRMEQARPAHDDAVILARAAEKRLRKAQEGALVDDSDLLDLSRKAAQARDAVPALPRLIIDDARPEITTMLLAEHGERLAVLSTEADLFDMLLQGKPGQRANMNVYLKSWSGDEVKRDRKGGSDTGPETTILTHPLLTVSCTVQPSVLARLQTDDEMVGRGFAARFMFAMPDDLMGSRDQRRRFRGGHPEGAEAFETTATALAERWGRWTHPGTIDLSPEAAGRFEDWLVELEPHLAPDAALGRIAEWVAKLTASVARYAGLLHLAEHHDTTEAIDEATMVRAITLGRYWIAHAIGVGGLAVDRTVAQADAILEWIERSGVDTFTIADLQKHVRRPGAEFGLDKARDYVPAVELLIERRYVRASDGTRDAWAASVGVKGSPSPRFDMSPLVTEMSLIAHEPRVPRTASMGERDFSLSPYRFTTPPTPRGTRYTRFSDEGSPVDNPSPEPDRGRALGIWEPPPIDGGAP